MIRFKKILIEQDQKLKGELRDGLMQVASRSHLVTDQVRNNIEEFLENLDTEKFKQTFGDIKKILGVGVFGVVFGLKGKRVLKITFDYHEAPFLFDLSKKSVQGLVEVDKVLSFDFGDTMAYGIIRDGLTPITETSYRSEAREVLSDMKHGNRNKKYNSQIKKQVKKALNAMYNLDPDWRGTHLENLGIQNGEVVLYDGFSKGVEQDASKVPKKNLKT